MKRAPVTNPMINVPVIANPNRRPVTELGTSVYESAKDTDDAVGVIMPRKEVGKPGCNVMPTEPSLEVVVVIPPRRPDVVAFIIGATTPDSGVGTIIPPPLSVAVGLAVGSLGS
jgi:hypothetical protein